MPWTPGTSYYWRASAPYERVDPSTGGISVISLVSPVFTFIAKAPQGTSQTPYSECVELGAQTRNLTRRIHAVETALDLAKTPQRRKQLRNTLRRLRQQRTKVNRQAVRLCS